MTSQTIILPGRGSGTTHALGVHRFGTPGARPKVYVQGGLHADEGPGMATAWALIDALAGVPVQGEIVVVPAANPLGLGQRVLGGHVGRFDLGDGMNFNRGFANLAPAALARLDGRLGDDPVANVALVRAALAAALAALTPATPAERLKQTLMGLAQDADLVLDLHCDGEGVVHLYTLPGLAEPLAPLTARLGAAAVLVADESGLNPFDEALSRPFADIALACPGCPVPLACQAATVELRGEADVDAALAARDAAAILGFLADRGVLGAPLPGPGCAPAPGPACAATPLAGSEPLVAPIPGLVLYRAALGARVAAGDVVAEIRDPVTGAIAAVTATTSGVLYARAVTRIAEAGSRLGKIAGATVLRTGPLLSP